MVNFAGHKEKPLVGEQPSQTTKTSIISEVDAGQVDPALARFLEEHTHEALDAAISRMESATNRFNEATGDQVDAACFELTAAQNELRAVYARAGNTLTPEKAFRIMQLLSSGGGSKLRPEYQIAVTLNPKDLTAIELTQEEALRFCALLGVPESIIKTRVIQ